MTADPLSSLGVDALCAELSSAHAAQESAFRRGGRVYHYLAKLLGDECESALMARGFSRTQIRRSKRAEQIFALLLSGNLTEHEYAHCPLSEIERRFPEVGWKARMTPANHWRSNAARPTEIQSDRDAETLDDEPSAARAAALLERSQRDLVEARAAFPVPIPREFDHYVTQALGYIGRARLAIKGDLPAS